MRSPSTPISLSIAAGAARPGEDHDGVVVAVHGVVDDPPGVLAQPGRLQAGAAALGVRVGVAGQHLVADEVLEEGQGPPGCRVVGVRHPAPAVGGGHHVVLTDDGLANAAHQRLLARLRCRALGHGDRVSRRGLSKVAGCIPVHDLHTRARWRTVDAGEPPPRHRPATAARCAAASAIETRARPGAGRLLARARRRLRGPHRRGRGRPGRRLAPHLLQLLPLGRVGAHRQRHRVLRVGRGPPRGPAPSTRTCSTARSPWSPTRATPTSSSGSGCSPPPARPPPTPAA